MQRLLSTVIRLSGLRWVGRMRPHLVNRSSAWANLFCPATSTRTCTSFNRADLFTRPDGADLNSVRPYKDEVAWIKSHIDDVFARYIRCGITSVVDVGGPMWNFDVRKKANATAKAPRVAVAGPLISSVSREKLDLGDPPIVKIENPQQAREFVRKLVQQKPDLVKIWYIVDKDHPVDSFRPIARATIEESHAHKIR